jgi:hypothetical protein
MADK